MIYNILGRFIITFHGVQLCFALFFTLFRSQLSFVHPIYISSSCSRRVDRHAVFFIILVDLYPPCTIDIMDSLPGLLHA